MTERVSSFGQFVSTADKLSESLTAFYFGTLFAIC